jgi:hypothetical protein
MYTKLVGKDCWLIDVSKAGQYTVVDKVWCPALNKHIMLLEKSPKPETEGEDTQRTH